MGISSRLLHPCVSARFSAKVEVLQEPVAFLGVSDVTIDGGLVHDENLRERPNQNAKNPSPSKSKAIINGGFLTIIVQLSFNDPLIRLSYFAQVRRGVWAGRWAPLIPIIFCHMPQQVGCILNGWCLNFTRYTGICIYQHLPKGAVWTLRDGGWCIGTHYHPFSTHCKI